MGRISALTELTSLASDDYLVVLDSSANIAKKITVANAFGIPDQGFIAAGESWTYSAWSSTTRIAQITVPTDATTKYYDGMRVKFTQPTDGVKIGIIQKVEATKLHVMMHADYDFDNEAITSPFYSSEYAPAGFDLNPVKWTLEYTSTTNHSQSSPTINVWYNPGSELLTVGVGAYDLSYECNIYAQISSGSTSPFTTLSTANNSESDARMTNRTGYVSPSSGTAATLSYSARRKPIKNTAQTTFYLNIKVDTGSYSAITLYNDNGNSTIRAKCAYV